MSYDSGQETIYFDQKWIKKIRKNSVRSNGFLSKRAKIQIDELKKTLTFEPYIKSVEVEEKDIAKKLDYLEKIKQEIAETEQIPLVRDYYVRKTEETVLRTQIQLIQLKSSREKRDQSYEIGTVHEKLFPLPPQEYFELFINEFIFFFKYLYDNSLYNLRSIDDLEEVFEHSYYAIEETNVSIDCEQIADIHSFFSKRESSHLENTYSPDQIKTVLEKFLQKMKFGEYSRLKISIHGIFSVNDKRTIKVPGKTRITKRRIYELIAHEILVHVGRSIDGKLNSNQYGKKLKMLEIGKTAEIFTIEEGLATYFEQNIFYDSDKHDILNLLTFYVRTIAVYLATKFQPFEVYKKLEKLCLLVAMIKDHDSRKAEEQRLSLLSRIYRDYEIPVKGAVNGKVSVYLYGNRLVWEHKAKGTNIYNLFAGKVTFEQVDQLKDMNFTVPTGYLDSKEFPREKILSVINECF